MTPLVRRLPTLFVVLSACCIASTSSAQLIAPSFYATTIQVQGETPGTEFDDWTNSGITVIDMDPLDNPGDVDFANVQVANDDEFIYIRVSTHNAEPISLANVYLGFDTDQDKATGFDVLQIGEIGSELGYQTDFPFAQCAEIRAVIESTGLRMESLASGMTWGCSPSHPDPAIRRRAVELNETALQRAAWLGCKSLLFIPGAVAIPWDPGYGFVHYGQAVEWAHEATKTLAITAEQVGVELCIENVWNGLFYSPLEYRDFIDSIGSPAVGAYFDVGNCMGQHQYPPHWIEILGSRIKRVHLKDFKRSVGTLDGFCDLLEGDQPWAETMAALRAIGYDRTLTAEMIPFAPGRVGKTGAAMRQIVRM